MIQDSLLLAQQEPVRESRTTLEEPDWRPWQHQTTTNLRLCALRMCEPEKVTREHAKCLADVFLGKERAGAEPELCC